MNHETMRRVGFSLYGPSKAALEAATAIWAQDLAGSGVTVNALLPGGATLTGMIPEHVDPALKAKLLDPGIIIPPLLWLASTVSDGVTGMRLNASQWSDVAGVPRDNQDETSHLDCRAIQARLAARAYSRPCADVVNLNDGGPKRAEALTIWAARMPALASELDHAK